jgi:hypothetical protein
MKMKKIGLVLLLTVCQITWGTVTNIYTDTTIESGTYDTVNIYDSLDAPPIQTMVDMTGGLIYSCDVYNTAILNFNDGEIGTIYTNNSSIVNMSSVNTPTMYLYNDSQIHIYNGSAGPSVSLYDNAELHIYGYNLDYDEIPSPNWVTGQWENGQDFTIYLRNIYSYNPSQVVLHEIPEPTTFLLFVFGGYVLRRNRNHFISKD